MGISMAGEWKSLKVADKRDNALRAALKENGISDEEYNIGGYCECCVCIERSGSGWTVYDAERGNKYEKRFRRSIDEVAKDVHERLGFGNGKDCSD